MSFIPCSGGHEWIEPTTRCHSVSPRSAEPICTPCSFDTSYRWEAKSIGGSHSRVGYDSPETGSAKKFLRRETSVHLDRKTKMSGGYPGYVQTLTVQEDVSAEFDELGNETIEGSGTETARAEGRLVTSPYTLCSYYDQNGSISIDEDGCVSGSWSITGRRPPPTGGCEPTVEDDSDGTYSGQRKQARTCPNVAGMSPYGDFEGCNHSPSTTTITEDSETVEHDEDLFNGHETYTWQATYLAENTDEMMGMYLDGAVADVLPILSLIPFGASYSIFKGARQAPSACGVGYKPLSLTYTDADMAAAIEAAEEAVADRQSALTEAQAEETAAMAAMTTWQAEWQGIHQQWKAWNTAICNGEEATGPDGDVWSRYSQMAVLEAELAAAIHNRLDAETALAGAQAQLDAAQQAADMLQDGLYSYMPIANYNAGSVYRRETTIIGDTAVKEDAMVRLRIDIPRIAKTDERYSVSIPAAGHAFEVEIPEGECYVYTPEFMPPEEVDLLYEEVEITKIEA